MPTFRPSYHAAETMAARVCIVALMTFVLALLNKRSIWLVTDRRLSSRGRQPRDDALKTTMVEGQDGIALLGYAGLGATAAGTQPSDWMARVLRGRGASIADSLGLIGDAMLREMPPHMRFMNHGNLAAHLVVAAAYVANEPTIYSLSLVRERGGDARVAFNRQMHKYRNGEVRRPRMIATGSGTAHLPTGPWQRDLMRIANAHDRRQASDGLLAQWLAKLVAGISVRDKFVSSKCVVSWHITDSAGGGGTIYFSDGIPDDDWPMLPTVWRGSDANAIVAVLLQNIAANSEGRAEPSIEQINSKLAALPKEPDENFR